jgi:hypothetical protein
MTETTVVIMLPIIIKDASDVETPQNFMDTGNIAPWEKGAIAWRVRTHFHLENKFLADHL